jgi:hypothetical protein
MAAMVALKGDEALDPLLEMLLGGEVAAAEQFAHRSRAKSIWLSQEACLGVKWKMIRWRVAQECPRAAIDWRMPIFPSRRDFRQRTTQPQKRTTPRTCEC